MNDMLQVAGQSKLSNNLCWINDKCQECVTRGKHTSRAWDAASATQAEHYALHLTHVPYLLDGRLAVLRRRGGKNLVDICTNCIQLYLTGL